MKTTPAPKRGLVSDNPTGTLWQDCPVGHLWMGCVRTSFCVLREYRTCPPSRGSRSPATASWSRSSSISWESRTRSTAPTALCGSGGERQSPPQYRAEAGACPRPDRQSRTRRAANESAVAPVAFERLSTSSKAAVVGAGWVLSISCTCAKVTPESKQTANRASDLEVWR